MRVYPQDQVLGKFARMVAVGLPLDRVLHKMKSEQTSDADIERFEKAFGDSSSDSTSTESATLPVTPAPVIADSAALKAELKQDPVLGKFAKMMAVGLPMDSVLHKMTSESVGAADQERFKDAFGGNGGRGRGSGGSDSGGGGGAATPTAPAKDTAALKAQMKADPILGKFAKMLSVGLPVDSVLHNMVRWDGTPDCRTI